MWVNGVVLAGRTRRTSRCSTAASSWATASSRRSGASGGRVTELAEHVARLGRSAAGLDIELPADVAERVERGIADLLAAEGLDGPTADASIRITVTRGAWASRGLLPPRDVHLEPTIAIQAWPVVAGPGRRTSSAASTSSRRRCGATRPTRS